MADTFNFPIPDNAWGSALPVAIVAITGILTLLLGLSRSESRRSLAQVMSLGGLILAAVFLVLTDTEGSNETMGGMLTTDRFGDWMQFILLLSAGISILFSESYLRDKKIRFAEFYPLILWSTVGGMLMSSTDNLLMLFIGLEILSISLYVLAGLSRLQETSEESAMKYFLLGAFASGFLLFGTAFIYGATGSLQLTDITTQWHLLNADGKGLILFGVAMVLVGLGFKASFVPFHQWTPDVYQGAPTNVTSFMATGSKVAAIAALARFLYASQPLHDLWMPAMYVVAGLTMIVGNLLALVQKDVKRILAYSSIAHAGYILVALLAHVSDPQDANPSTVTFYLLSYAVTTAGAFAALSLAARKGVDGTSLEDIRGMWQRSPFAAGTLAVCMLSLMGIPPTAGFVGKALIFTDAVRADMTPLAIILAISSVISVYFYLGIARAAMAADDDTARDRLSVASPGVIAACAISLASVIMTGVFFTPIIHLFK